MDQTTKQRLVGATVLVIALLWVVPVFLDGPSDTNESMSQTIELPGMEAQTNKLKTIELAPSEPKSDETRATPTAENGEEGPVAKRTTAAKSSDTSRPKVEVAVAAKSQPEPKSDEAIVVRPPPPREPPQQEPPQETPPKAGTVTSALNLWAVQLGSFSGRDNAEKLAADLRKAGFAAFISEHPTGTQTLHRVRIGPLKGRDAAETEAVKLAARGHKGQVVSHP